MDNKFSNIKERVLYLAKYKGITLETFFTKIGMTYGNFKGSAKLRPLNSDAIVNILSIFTDINSDWLLTGKGNMLIENNVVYDKIEEPQATYGKNNCDEVREELKYAEKTISELKTENKELTKELGRKELIIEQKDHKLLRLEKAKQE